MLFANASISTFPSLGNHHYLLNLRLPYSLTPHGLPRLRTVARLCILMDALRPDGKLLASSRASLDSFLAARRRTRNVACIMGNLVGFLGCRCRTYTVVDNSGVLLNSSHSPQINAHGLVICLNNAYVVGDGLYDYLSGGANMAGVRAESSCNVS
ncbi:hypothetical protein E2562_015266 [Oryza meyeriana var. granulata]|uniref:Uncharacterized protein n=1 Tax=Oryza meyeriana var. granulata TaxID=110450 RepID=A0A6G1DJJ2_9ORYZ|nr:hypothetical protein E2562_015266 [Oryza meyeriana var. granulata]